MAEEISTGELARRLDRLGDEIKTRVSREAYDSDQRGQGDRIGRAESRLRDIESAREREAAARQVAETQMQQWKRQAQLSISLAILAAVVSIALFIAGVISP